MQLERLKIFRQPGVAGSEESFWAPQSASQYSSSRLNEAAVTRSGP